MSRDADSEETSILRFQRQIEKKYGLQFEDFWQFHKWSVTHYEELWAEVFDFFEIIHSKPYTKVIQDHKTLAELPEWFPGARLNYTENMLRYPEGTALLLLGEEKTSAEKVSFQQLRDEVATVSAALRKAGFKQGDIIACYMSTRKEALLALLAAGSIGALFTAVNPLMGLEAIISRLKQVSPKVLFTIDRFLFNKEEKDVLKNLPKLVTSLPELELVIIVPSNDQSLCKNISNIPNSCFYPHFFTAGLKEDGQYPEPKYEQLPFSHPLLINFTSGTTGKPKGIVHSAGASLLVIIKEMHFELDMRPTDVTFMIQLLGWVSFYIFLGGLPFGATVVLYEGMPFLNSEPSYWDLVDTYGITAAFLTPTILEEMDKKDFVPGPHNTLKTLRYITSGSSPVKAYIFDLVQNRIKRGLRFNVLYGCTEFLTMMAGPNATLPIYKEEMQAPALGLDLLCYNQSGESVLDEEGELVVVNPWPSHPMFVWKDKKCEKFTSDALTKFPGVWWVGDICKINSKTHGLIVPGRCDDTVKNRGYRFGSSEIYGVVNKMQEVEDSICVSRIIKSGHEVAILFIKMKKGNDFTPEFLDHVRSRIKEELSFGHIPEMILPVKAVPVNLNGKRMEVLVKKILAGVKDLPMETLANPDCIAEYVEYAKSTY